MSTTASVGAGIGNCELTGTLGDMSGPVPRKAGELTVAVSLPAPIWWMGDTPAAIKDGYEYCLAAAIAWHAGIDKLQILDVDWAGLTTGTVKDYDLALSQIATSGERRKTNDVSVPYFDLDLGVLVKSGTAADEKTVKTMRVGALKGSAAADFAMQYVQPKTVDPFPEFGELMTALRAGNIDAVLAPVSVALAEAAMEKGAVTVVGQYKTGAAYAALYPKGSANTAGFDKIISALKADGTLTKLAQKYLVPVWGKDPATLPYFTP